MVGILSEVDVIRHTGGVAPTDLAEDERARPAEALAAAKSQHVADIMTTDVVMAGEDTPLREIADLFLKHGIKRVPILRDRSVVGIVGRIDLLQALISLGPEAYAHKPADAQTTDDTLRASVMAALQRRNWSQARRSDVVISHGVVHLWGTVANDSIRSTYVETLQAVPG
jgi:CBS-domain-containing membrane protein